MENIKNQLAEKLKKDYSYSNLQEVINYCKQNIHSMDLNNDTDFYLCSTTNLYLFKQKIGCFNKDETKFLTISLSKLGIKMFNIKEEKINIELMESEEYKKFRGKNSMAVCIKNDNTHSIIYSDKVCEEIMSSDPYKFLRGLQTIFHETVHIFQDEKIQKDYTKLNAVQAKNAYIMALEKVSRMINPEFYEKNYSSLLNENDAEKNGLIAAMEVLKIYNKKVYNFFDKDELEQKMKKYDGRSSENQKEIFGIKPKEGQTIILMEFLTKEWLKRDTKLLKDYPILEIAYNKDGTQKNVIELLEDRNLMLNKRDNLTNNSIEDINDLFFTIIHNRDRTDSEFVEEIDSLEKYILSKNIKDDFVYEILHNRLQRFGLEEKMIEKRIGDIKYNIEEKNKTLENSNFRENIKSYTYSDAECVQNIVEQEEVDIQEKSKEKNNENNFIK